MEKKEDLRYNQIKKLVNMDLPLVYYNNPTLRKKSIDVDQITDEIQNLINNMLETLISKNGIGLAAPQINSPLSIFITYAPIEQEDGTWAQGTPRVFINPKIIEMSKETDVREEGCLSIPGIFIPVERSLRVKVRSVDLHGNTIEQEFQNFEARVVQHEYDHINGVLMIDHLGERNRKKLESKLHKVDEEFNI